ncbi:MAG: hypothetical protein II929_08415 [Succinivibrio sp.]|nr:hypothetical protein [Succinivibrio sp.]
MTDKLEQDINPKKNTYTIKISEIKQLCIRDFFTGEKEINFRQFYLPECGFIFGDKNVRFIKKNISAFFKISPTVEKHYVADVFSEGTASFLDWDRLYIEIFGRRYVVTKPVDSDNKYIYCGIEETDSLDSQDDLDSKKTQETQDAQGAKETLETPVTLSVKEYNSEEEIPHGNSCRLGSYIYMSIKGKIITIWRNPNTTKDTQNFDNLINRVSILYIIAHAYVRKIESFVEEISSSEGKNRDDSYKKYLDFRLKNYRSNPVVIETSVMINKVWRFLYDYFCIEKKCG